MARFEKHCEECLEKLGKTFADVHLWLDEFVNDYPVEVYDDYHRRFRHNVGGIEHVRELWGDEAAIAAELHILTDMGYIKNWKPMKINYDE